MKPLVSIICPTYNHEKYITDAIESFLMQKVEFPIEIIIHDDASTDATADIIRSYEKKYPTIIKPIYQKENQYSKGKPPTYFIYKRAQGKYIASCEGDDYWTDPYKLKKQVEFLENHPEYIAVTHNVRVVNEYNKLIKNNFNEFKIFDEHVYTIRDAEKLKMPFQTASKMYRNIWVKIPEIIFRLYLECNANGDRKNALMLAFMGKVYCMADILAVHRKIVSLGDSWNAKHYWKNMIFHHYNTIKELNKFAMNAFGVKLNNEEIRINIIVNAIVKMIYKPNKENMKVVKEILKISDESKLDIFRELSLRGIKKINKSIKSILK